MITVDEMGLIQASAKLVGLLADYNFYEDRINVRRRKDGGTLFTGRSESAADWFWRHYGPQVHNEIGLRLHTPPCEDQHPLLDELRRLRKETCSNSELLRMELRRLNEAVEVLDRQPTPEKNLPEQINFGQDWRHRMRASDVMHRKVVEAVEEYRKNTGEKPNLFCIRWWHPYETGKGFLRDEPFINEVGFE